MAASTSVGTVVPDTTDAFGSPALVADPDDPDCLRAAFEEVRSFTERLAAPLGPEDQVVQSMPDVSPTKWHRAHTTWFFETFVLTPHLPGYQAHHPAYGYLFNSYYEAVGPRHPRPHRGLLTRPTVTEVATYRTRVDEAVSELLGRAHELPTETWSTVRDLVELGLHHEQQHQELLLMDAKHVLSCNPMHPAYRTGEPGPLAANGATRPLGWIDVEGGLVEVGHCGGGFSFDNEGPRHRVQLEPYRLADRPVTCGEWLAFMDDDGYRRATLWLSDGWATVATEGWDAPLYWQRDGDDWSAFTLDGLRPVDENEPVVHLSFYEADAFARWAGARLPTEAEWEHAASHTGERFADGNDLTTDALHPQSVCSSTTSGARSPLRQLHGDVWEWTASPYVGYPGFRPAAGAVGEYNGKFMCNQVVLRGGCCVTPPRHLRVTYRNFFPAHARWMFAGMRLAADG